MIHVGILGADTPIAGELIRILAMHPDVTLEAAQAKGLEGIALSSVHHGLIGETDLQFTASVDYTRCDVIFLASKDFSVSDLKSLLLSRPGLKVIAIETPYGEISTEEGIVYGLPEMNRKLLVRGAPAALVPQPFASMALVALFPFASNLLLNGDVRIEVDAPQALIKDADVKAIEKEIMDQLRATQRSFNGEVHVVFRESEARRSSLMSISFDCSLALEQTLNLYDCYDDHRFSFVTTAPVGVSEVAGTNKCVISVIKKDPSAVELSVAADCRLRGGAGEAVHIMNLMFGLHEKTGLRLKAIDYEPI